jgi:hypothetical protein
MAPTDTPMMPTGFFGPSTLPPRARCNVDCIFQNTRDGTVLFRRHHNYTVGGHDLLAQTGHDPFWDLSRIAWALETARGLKDGLHFQDDPVQGFGLTRYDVHSNQIL